MLLQRWLQDSCRLCLDLRLITRYYQGRVKTRQIRWTSGLQLNRALSGAVCSNVRLLTNRLTGQMIRSTPACTVYADDFVNGDCAVQIYEIRA